MTSPNARRRGFMLNTKDRETVYVIRNIWNPADLEKVNEAIRRAVSRSGGVLTNRHNDFPTVDIPAYKLSARALAFVTKAVREKVLAPAAMRLGLDPDDLYFKDLFIVFYEAANGQSELALHQDGSLFSFNISLSDNYTGGGTYFPESLGVVREQAGSCVLHDGKMIHGGNKITAGSRWILVGFVNSIVGESDLQCDEKKALRLEREIQCVSERSKNARKKGQVEVEDALQMLMMMDHGGDQIENETNSSIPCNDIYAKQLEYIN